MMTNKGDIEEKLQCPYDKSHHILKHRMQTHLVKCRRNHLDMKVSTCPFNSVHIIADPELNYHKSVCPDRLGLDKHFYKPETVESNRMIFPDFVPNITASVENWDDQEEVPTYNPEEYCRSNPVLRNNIHTKPSAVRRNFRAEERVRMQQFEDTAASCKQQQLGGDAALQKLRRPMGLSVGASINNASTLDVNDMLQKIQLNDNVLTIPKVPTLALKSTEMHKSDVDDIDTPGFEKDYPPLANKGAQPNAAPWSAATLAMRGVTSNGTPYRYRGRGSNLAKKN